MAKFYKNFETNKIFCSIGSNLDLSNINIEEIKAGSTDAALEKHVPVVKEEDGKVLVKVGSIDHPMESNHYIEWIAVVTDRGFQVRYLKPGQVPGCLFLLDPSEIVLEVYAYCNLHGLWKSKSE